MIKGTKYKTFDFGLSSSKNQNTTGLARSLSPISFVGSSCTRTIDNILINKISCEEYKFTQDCKIIL